jgi:hypothetical protein
LKNWKNWKNCKNCKTAPLQQKKSIRDIKVEKNQNAGNFCIAVFTAKCFAADEKFSLI